MVIFGGSGPKALHNEDTYFNDVWDLNLDTLSWTFHNTTGTV